MSSIRISQLQTVNSTGATDFLVINDADDAATRKIRFDDFSAGFIQSDLTTDQTIAGGLSIGGTNIDLQSGGNISINGLYTAAQQADSDLLFSGFKAGAKSFEIKADGNLQIGGTIGDAGAATANIELEADGTSHFQGVVMGHRATGTDYAFQVLTGSTTTAQISAAGTYEAGGSINIGGVPAIAVTAGGAVAMAGSYGSAGQVLVSQGAAQPMVWQDQAGVGATKGQKGDQGQKGSDGPKGQKGTAAGVLHYQGTSPDVASLPSTGNTIGDLYHVITPDSWYAWNGSTWQQMNNILEGPKGEKGQKGHDGAQGPAGTNAGKGEKGQKGVGGTKGEPGQKGATGAGTKGQKGAAGVDAVGTKGNTGQKGQKGQKGEGDKGQKGSASGLFDFKGDVSTQGELPANGNTTGDVYRVVDSGTFFAWNGTAWVPVGDIITVKGDKGSKGTAGVKGDKGDKGTKGDLGPTGNDGQQGIKGQKGQTGANGTNGTDGTNGAKGAQGQKGTSGADAAAGATDQIQFNSSGSLAANSNFRVNPGTGTLYSKQIQATGTGVNQIGDNVNGASLYLYTDSAYIGNSGSTIQLYGKLASNAIPNADNTYNLGSSTDFWKVAYAKQVNLSTATDQQITTDLGSAGNVRGLNIGGIWVSTGQSGARSIYIGDGAGTDGGNTIATENDVVCLGYRAGYDGAGAGSVLIGSQAGASLHQALGSQNVVCIGHKAMVGNFNNDVENTVVIGDNIAPAFRSGTNNIFLGSEEVQNLGSGQTSNNGNISIGAGPNYGWTGGSGNVFIGGYTTNGAFSPVTALSGVVNNTIALGSSMTTDAYVKVAWTVTSDKRDKVVYGGVPHGLNFVDALRPVAYQFKKGGRHSDMGDGKLRYGFLAQEIADLEGQQKVIIDDSYADCLKYTSDHMIPILVNAIQDLKQEVDSLRAKLYNN